MAALEMEDDDVYVRVVDVGAGLCAVVRAPGNHFMVFDAGHWNGQHCIQAARELVTGDAIDLMVISHSDADHLGDGARILTEKRVRQTILAGEVRDTGSWESLVNALVEEVKEGGSVHNLQSVPLVAGTTIPLGDATVTLVAGWPVWTEPGPTESERRNAISVVVRLEYRSRTVLFTGDIVGRRLTDLDDACKDAEKVMVDRHNAGEVSLKSDVLIASQHLEQRQRRMLHRSDRPAVRHLLRRARPPAPHARSRDPLPDTRPRCRSPVPHGLRRRRDGGV
jgi:beta-lactamase superfamily II metal-dependent hydrolase